MNRKKLDRIFKQHEKDSDQSPETNGPFEDLMDILNTMLKVTELESDFRADTKNPKLEVRVYGNRTEVEYECKDPIYRALAAEMAVTNILKSVKNREIREKIIAFACKDTNTFLNKNED